MTAGEDDWTSPPIRLLHGGGGREENQRRENSIGFRVKSMSNELVIDILSHFYSC